MKGDLMNKTNEFTCVMCSRRDLNDNETIINVAHIRIRSSDQPENHGWAKLTAKDSIFKAWVCPKCADEVAAIQKG